MKKKIILIFLFLAILFNYKISISAQSGGGFNNGQSQGEGLDGSNSSGGGFNSASDPTCNTTGIDTAIGCIDVLSSPEAFAGDLLKWGVGVGGGIAFLLIVYAGFMIMSSSGNPERLKAGQELMTSAISGIVLLIFSIFILNLIGVKILQIPDFGNPKPDRGAARSNN